MWLERDIDQPEAVTSAREARTGAEPASVQVELTARQALCLRWSVEGKSMRAIAAMEGMFFATVNFHLKMRVRPSSPVRVRLLLNRD
ncbi:MAG: hypothetical protein EOS31_12340 [Mesorhizobium sp.]|nr:MAG: hypothetical protein EOS31_12340 [Mesorhizobium sp.]RWF55709.1 MAG: hypothetical protein EOS66_12555 [Mesorhizobium sp.]